ncbi:hypothetical protein D3C76_1076700 [compost metagenome]
MQLLNPRQLRRLVLAHQRSFAGQRSTDAATDRRPYLAVTEIEPGAGQVGLGRPPIGLGALELGHRVVEGLRADGVDFHQLLEALRLGIGTMDVSLGLGQRTLGSHQGSLERRRVDAEQQLTGLDVTALLKMSGQDHTGHPCAHLGDAHRLNASGQIRSHGKHTWLHGQRLHLGHWRSVFGGLSLTITTTCPKYRQQQPDGFHRGENLVHWHSLFNEKDLPIPVGRLCAAAVKRGASVKTLSATVTQLAGV